MAVTLGKINSMQLVLEEKLSAFSRLHLWDHTGYVVVVEEKSAAFIFLKMLYSSLVCCNYKIGHMNS